MRKLYSLLFVLFVLCYSLKAQVVINEVYGGGGNSGAPYTNDFVELYNNSGSPVTMTSWSIQYTSANGTTWGSNKVTFTGTIPANGYFLIQLSSGGAVGVALPAADASGAINMSATAGKLVLCNNATNVSSVVNPTDANIVDKVGYGGTAATTTGYEGTGPAPAPSNSTSIQRTPIGTDNNNNSADFTAGTPSPNNATGGPDVTPPTITTLLPADNATGVATSFTATITFSEFVQKGTGTITLKKSSDNSVIGLPVDVTNASVTVSGAAVSFDINSLLFNTGYYFEISSGAFKDLANNNFVGVTGSTTWNFTTAATPPTGLLNNTYSFNTCSGNLPDGFTQYSVTGAITWACTTFGRDPSNPTASAANGIQINGFSSGTNVPNIDWFISPKFDLTATTFPLLSFWSRTAFNGAPLQLKISTDYSGTGNPNTATWTDLNGKFPGLASDIWTQSPNINLSAYKGANVYFAFVYTSTDEEGARWTLDDIRIDNSATPPPPSLTVGTNDIQYTYVASGATANKTFTFTGNDITSDVTITSSSSNFLLSKDGATFSSAITYTLAEANNITKTVFVQFAPNQINKTFLGALTISTSGLTGTVNTKGTSIDPAITLEVVNWNIEWFGSTAFGPTNENQQEQNVKTILQNIGADVYALTEVVDETRLANVVSQMPGYSYAISNYGSHTNTSVNPPSALAEAQKLAFVYKTSVLSNVTTTALVSAGINSAADIANPAYNYFASGRFPYMMSADVTLNGVTKNIKFVLIHAKANTSPTLTSYDRRKKGADTLNYTLNLNYPNDNIIILGDYNDDLDSTITAGITPRISSYKTFTDDVANFTPVTLPLSLAGKKSTVSFNDVIDHVTVSNELKSYYMNSTASILTDVSTLVTSYGSTTTDHYPVFTRFAFDPAILLPVKLVSFNATKEANSVKVVWATSQEINTKEFIVERSTDGVNFKSLTTVGARGNSNVTSSYGAIDAQPSLGNNYYRLKTVDFDGKSEYSRIVKINFSKAFTVSLSPNPASDHVIISLTNSREPVMMQIVDMAGKIVKSSIIRNTVNSISLSGLSKGLYLVKLIGATESYTEKLVID